MATYFVKNGGTDSNTGLSDAQAWAHSPGMTGATSTAASTVLAAGDSVLFRVGDIFRATVTAGSSGTLAGGYITYGSYGGASALNPRITGADVMSSFSNGGSNIWDKSSVTTQPLTVIISGVKGTKAASRAACTAPGNWFWAANTLSVFATSDPSGLVEAGQRNIVLDINSKDFIAVTSLTLDGPNAQCLKATGANIIVSGVQMKWSAFQGILGRGITNGLFSRSDAIGNGQTGGWQFDTSDSNLVFSSCSAQNNLGHGWDFEDCVNVTFKGGIEASFATGNGSATLEGNGINITQNVGFQPSCYFYIYDFISNANFGNGLDSISATATTDIGNHDLYIIGGQYSNAIASTDQTSGIRLDQNTFNSVVAYVQAFGNNSAGIVNEVQSHNNSILYNRCWGNARGITFSNIPGAGNVALGNVCHGNTFTGFECSGATAAGLIQNNIFYANGTYGYSTDGSFADNVDYNCVFGNSTANYNGIAKPTHDINADPKFANATAHDYRLLATSPAINAGLAQAFAYRMALSPLTPYANTPMTLDQNAFGTSWEMGAFVNVPTYQLLDGRVH